MLSGEGHEWVWRDPQRGMADAPSRGSWSGEGFPPSAPSSSHWSPYRTGRWGFLSGWENRGKIREDGFKMYEKQLKRHRCHTAPPEYRCPGCCQSISDKPQHRSDYICTHEWLGEQTCHSIYVTGVWVHVPLHLETLHASYSCYSHTEMDLCVCVCVCVCVRSPLLFQSVFVCACVCHSSYDWMRVGAQSQRNPVMNEPPIFQLLQGQPERKQNGWVTLSQHPASAASLHHSSSELNSAAKPNKESNYYRWNLYWPSSAILPKGNTLIEMFISEMRGGKKKKKKSGFIQFNGLASFYCSTTEHSTAFRF